ncbi:MAG: T9SS type A sorting domain-containing protein, partial [SAR324 cluster bacterium]|nr:T9SS type A sorting domain-containing protein [SAR324 cluster bacterium]
VITWLRDVNSADASLNSIPSSASGYVLIEVELSIDDEIELPTRIALFPAFPNPFNPRTNIRYDLPQTGYVDLRIFDLSGREVRTLARGFDLAGTKTVVWDAKDNQGQNVSAGVYVYRLEAAGFVQSQKLIYLK